MVMRKSNDLRLPLILACCGCSENAQIASDVANVMDSEGFAKQLFATVNSVYPEPQWVNKVRGGRPIMLLDGCNKCCMQCLLKAYNISASWHINLFDYGLHPTLDGLHSLQQLNAVVRHVQNSLSTYKTE
jgi:uncharacterized metal-binding protein